MNENIIQQAQEKLNKENTDNSSVKENLKQELLKRIENNSKLAEAVLNPLKTLDTMKTHIRNWAEKKAVNGCAIIWHEDVYNEMENYFINVEEKEVPEIKQPVLQPKPTTPIVPKTTPKQNQYACNLFGNDEEENQ